MKTRLTTFSAVASDRMGFPNADELAALRAWYSGLAVREAVVRYLPGSVAKGPSARGILGQIRRRLVAVALRLHRDDLVSLLEHPAADRLACAKAVAQAIDVLRTSSPPSPQVSDDIGRWLAADRQPRAGERGRHQRSAALENHAALL